MFAGAVVSATLLGVLLSALGSAFFLRAQPTRNSLVPVALIHIIALMTCMVVQGYLILISWFIAGLCSGVYMQIGIIAAANAVRKQELFLSRLVSALLTSGVLALLVMAFPELRALNVLCISYAGITVAFFMMYYLNGGAIRISRTFTRKQSSQDHNVIRGVIGLAILHLFFVGQTGILSHVARIFPDEGGDIATLASSIAAAKVGVGAAMVSMIFLLSRKQTLANLLSLVVLCGCIFVMSPHMIATAAFIILFVFELSFNVSASALMAQLAKVCSQGQRASILWVLLAGGVLGPIIAGKLVTDGLFVGLQMLASSAVVVSLLWLLWTLRHKAAIS